MQFVSLLVKTAKDLFRPDGDQLNKSRYILVETLHQNGSTSIYHCRLRFSHADVCLKVFSNHKCKKADRENLEHEILNEIAILRKINHPCLLGTTNIFLTQRRAVIEMDYMPGGDLYDYLTAAGKLCEKTVRFVMAQVFSGLHYLHQNNIVHRDIKLENILVEDPATLRVRISDFGLATTTDAADLTDFVGTSYYIAPELYRKLPYGKKVDCWAAGVVMYALLFARFPFKGEGSELVAGILRGKFTLGGELSPQCSEFVTLALTENVSRRFSSDEAVNHPFVKGLEILGGSSAECDDRLCYCHSESLLSNSRLTADESTSSSS